MIIDIQDWGLKQYRSWGFFTVQSDTIPVNANFIFSYCSNLDPAIISILFFSTKQLAGVNHVYLASYFAAKAINEGRNRAKDLGMEILLYLSGQNQINIATARYGISELQKKDKELWGVVFFTNSAEILLIEKAKLEEHLNISLLNTSRDTPILCNKTSTLFETNSEYLGVLNQIPLDFPQLPVRPTLKQEKVILQSIIEKMVLLSLDETKLEL